MLNPEPTVKGTLYVGTPDAEQNDLLVSECCWCGQPHRHIVWNTSLPWVIRHPRCKPWKTYLIRISNHVGLSAPLWTTDEVKAA